MKEDEVLRRAFSMPLTSPAFPPGPYRFVDREYLILTYRTDPQAIERILPAPLVAPEPIVKYEFINMPDSTGFGHYCESGQVIPVKFGDEHGGYVHSMYLNDHPPIAGGRELWGFPKKLGEPTLKVNKDTLVGTLHYSDVRVAIGSMGFKHVALDHDAVLASLAEPNFLLKIIPHVDGKPRICELVRYSMTEITVKGGWRGPGALELFAHALAPVADLPVREIVSAVHIIADLTLPFGTVVHDYLA
jgi:acetoacetate decarboxylase